MNSLTFRALATFLREKSGLVLTEDKIYLLESRLNPVAKRFGRASLDDVAVTLRSDRELATAVIEAMTTNESLFFRDVHPFEQLRTVILPELVRARGGRVRIWSAACSSGQEPYSIAMLVAEEREKLGNAAIEILATDISTDILARAKSGNYSHLEVQRGLPIRYLTKYFKRTGDRWELDPAIRAMVRFECSNLLDSAWPGGTFDVIFCRNVLIYFDAPMKSRILERFAEKMNSGGYLLLGGAETALGITNAFELTPNMRGVYRPARAVERRAVG